LFRPSRKGEIAIPERLERAKRFRASAQRLRALALEPGNEEDKAKSLAVARHYEKMADELERAASADGLSPAK